MTRMSFLGAVGKAFFSFFAVSSLCFLFSCSKRNPRVSEDGTVTLVVWESTNGPDEFIRQAGKIYEETHPKTKIKFVNVELGDAVGQIALDGPAGVGPDVFAAPHDKLGTLAIGGHVLYTEKADEVREKALPLCSRALTYDGMMYGYPVSAETYALFYNKSLIAEGDVPRTWEALADWTAKFNKENPGKNGFVMNVGDGYYTILFTTAAGNRLFGESGTDTENSNINSEKSVRGMEFFQSLRKTIDIPSADLDTASVDAAFQSGNAAMHITGLWNVVNFEKAGLDFGTAPLPSLPGDDRPAASFSGTRAMFVSAYSDFPDEANDFARFLMSDEMQLLRFKLTGALPSTRVPVGSAYLSGMMRQLEYAFPMPSIPEMNKYWNSMNNASKNIWDGADVRKELDACNRAILEK